MAEDVEYPSRLASVSLYANPKSNSSSRNQVSRKIAEEAFSKRHDYSVEI